MGSAPAPKLRIGVDVGGTNTDGVIIDPTKSAETGRGIVAWHKAPTTPDPSHGIADAITTMFKSASVNPDDVASVTIGTTHFVNAVITRDRTRLSQVAVIRLSGPFSKHAPPCVDWPSSLQKLILGHYALVKGGLEVDGALISDIKESEIVEQCQIIKSKGIKSVVVNGIFSPIDTIERQEERAGEIIQREIPGVDVVLSKTVANLGFLERENAAILNASILGFARKTIASFQSPIKALGLNCPVFITQNDGTILSGDAASKLPIRTFSSGPTNSMRGAAFLVGGEKGKKGEAMMVVDVGGTTTDVGLLLANGFPRQQAAYSELSGVRMNFSYPDVKSIGLGGGSLVRRIEGKLAVGPESVGYKLPEKALVFGGDVPTATDYTVAGSTEVKIGDPEKLKGKLDGRDIEDFEAETKRMLEKVIDTMKTSPEDLPVLLVGGGAVIAPDELKGASRVIKPEWSGVANAIGAAMARVSAVIDTVKSTEKKTTKEILAEISDEAKKKTVEAGALAESVEVVEVEDLPLAYIAHKTRFIVRAAGDFDYSRSKDFAELHISEKEIEPSGPGTVDNGIVPASIEDTSAEDDAPLDFDILAYKPKVTDRNWYVSETDLDWITIGCYILGTGGGGSPYSSMLRMRGILRSGGVIRVVNPYDLKDDDLVGCGCGAGSPTVGIEKLAGDDMLQAQEELYKLYQGGRATHMIALEIGGSNGLQGMIIGASTNMDIPVVDGDWMGRAYPTKWQTTPVVFNERDIIFAPVAVTDGNGNVLYMPAATSDLKVEQIIRVALSQMGSHVACADGPVTGAETKRWAVEHTISLSWRIGREVARARKENRIDSVAESIIDAVGGPGTGQVVFKGKIVGVERTLRMGHVYGEVIIEGSTPSVFTGKIKIPFKNENIAAIRIHEGEENLVGEEKDEDVLAIVPDLIAVIDAQNGEAIGTPEYRYGLLVLVIGITASERWTSPRGVEIGGPKGFQMDHLAYTPLGKFVKPVSVIDEYDAKV
ncbi:hydantoinase [Melanomma pulvis-pyrius CBS 109.77]|uniref:Hydantoinase n=1 Tax=Melanomma pulvis-pyrius CBS 109.77 TaxID=1314802 RepID=A0A6A6X637_9PLEO|nr:hydantoinase [Melanomma pulvis-pyrius CBS 109.77]